MKKNDVLDEIESYNSGMTENKPASGIKKAGAAILGIITLIIFLGGIMGAAIFGETEPKAAIMCVGAIFLWFGIIAIASTKMSLDNAPLLLFPVIGGLMVAIPGLMLLSENSADFHFEITESMIIHLLLFSMMIVGAAIIILPIINHRKKLERCSLSVQARCIALDMRISHTSKGRRVKTYAPKWEYYVNGQIYEVQEHTYSNVSVPTVGSVYEILVDPYEPTYIYRVVNSHRIMTLAMGIAFVVMPFIAIVMYGKQ